MTIDEKANILTELCNALNNIHCRFCPMKPCPLEAYEYVGELTEEQIKVIEDAYNKMFDKDGNVITDMLPETDITKMNNEQLLFQYKEDCFEDMQAAEQEILKRMKSV